MKVVELEFKILRIPEPVSLPFEGLDFVDQALDGATGDAMVKEVEKSAAVPGKGLAHFLEDLDPRVHRIPTPDAQKLLGLFEIGPFPEESELLFHGMNLKQRAVNLQKGIESGFAVRLKRVVVTQKQETASFKGLLPQGIEFRLVITPEFIDGLVHE